MLLPQKTLLFQQSFGVIQKGSSNLWMLISTRMKIPQRRDDIVKNAIFLLRYDYDNRNISPKEKNKIAQGNALCIELQPKWIPWKGMIIFVIITGIMNSVIYNEFYKNIISNMTHDRYGNEVIFNPFRVGIFCCYFITGRCPVLNYYSPVGE